MYCKVERAIQAFLERENWIRCTSVGRELFPIPGEQTVVWFQMRINPKFKSLIPPLSQEEYSQLEANILSDGCRDPLVSWNGFLVDGHNRYQICSNHNIEFEAIEYEFGPRRR